MLNIEKGLEVAPLEELGFWTITPKYKCTAIDLQKRFHSFMTGVLGEQVEYYVRVLELQKSGRPHFHLIAWFKGQDIRTGFNFEVSNRDKEIEKMDLPWQEKKKLQAAFRKEHGPLCKNVRLRWLWRLLERGRKQYGLGRMMLEPIEKNKEAVGKYLAKYLTKAPEIKLDAGSKQTRVRLVSYSRTYPKAASTRFTWYTAKAKVHKQKVVKFAALHGCFNPGDMTAKFGRHWAHNLRAAILMTPGDYSAFGYLGSKREEDGSLFQIWGMHYESVTEPRADLVKGNLTPFRNNVRLWAKQYGCMTAEQCEEKLGKGWQDFYKEEIESFDRNTLFPGNKEQVLFTEAETNGQGGNGITQSGPSARSKMWPAERWG